MNKKVIKVNFFSSPSTIHKLILKSNSKSGLHRVKILERCIIWKFIWDNFEITPNSLEKRHHSEWGILDCISNVYKEERR